MKEKTFYPFLDGFRALGIMMILGHHICIGFNLHQIFQQDSQVFTWLFFKAWQYLHIDLSPVYLFMEHIILHFKGILGVQIFFLISGFLIGRALLEGAATWKGMKRFWIRRFFRIYPAYALMVVATLIFYAFQGHSSFEEIATTAARYLLFLQNYFPRNIYLEHAWTLAIFEQFYLICPILIFIIYKVTTSNTKKRQWLLFVVFVTLMLSGPWIRYNYMELGRVFFTWPLQSPFPYFTLTYHLWSLCLGVLLAVLHPYWKNIKPNRTLGLVLWIIGGAGYFILFFMVNWGYYWGPWFLHIFGSLASICLFAAAFNGVSLLARRPWLQYIGRHSYGIYLWHILVLSIWAQWLYVLPPSLVIIGAMISCFVVGIISSNTLERYFLDLRDKIAK